MGDDVGVEELAKITSKLGEHEFRLTKLEKQMEQTINNVETLTNNVKALSKLVEKDHTHIKSILEDIKDLKLAYHKSNEQMQKNFNKLLDTLTQILKKKEEANQKTIAENQKFKDELIKELIKYVIIVALAAGSLKLVQLFMGVT